MISTGDKDNEKLELGDIRVLVPDPDYFTFELENRLVAILHDHRKIDGTLTVVYVDKLVEIATDRDFVITKNESNVEFDLALWIDFTTRVKENQLVQFPRLGRLDPNQLKKSEHFASLIQDTSLYTVENELLWVLGKYVPFYGDKVWLRRSKIMDSLNALSVDVEPEATKIRFVERISSLPTLNSIELFEIGSMTDARIACELETEFVRAILV